MLGLLATIADIFTTTDKGQPTPLCIMILICSDYYDSVMRNKETDKWFCPDEKTVKFIFDIVRLKVNYMH